MYTSNIGLIGLAVMGENLALNFESKGFTVSVFNRLHPGKENVVDRFLRGRGAGKHFIATYSIPELVASLKRPRKVMMMIRAGAPVDEMIQELLPHLEPGDVIIDGGNSDFRDTERRVNALCGNGDFGWRNRSFDRPLGNARRFSGSLAAGEGFTAGDRCQIG